MVVECLIVQIPSLDSANKQKQKRKERREREVRKEERRERDGETKGGGNE